MALIKSGLFDSARGSFGNLTLRERRNGRIELGKKRIPADPQSTAQLEGRAGYGRLLEVWKEKAWVDMTQYDRLAALSDISSWNAFVLRHQAAMSKAPGWYYGFAESSGDTLHDFRKDMADLTRYGAQWITYGPAQLSAMNFPTTYDRCELAGPVPMQLGFTENLKIEAQVRIPTYDNFNKIIAQGTLSGPTWTGYDALITYPGQLRFRVWAQTAYPVGDRMEIVTPNRIDDGEWHDIVLLLDRTDDVGRIYVDGNLEIEGPDNTTTGSENNGSIAIGANQGGGNPLQGDIREISIKIWEP